MTANAQSAVLEQEAAFAARQATRSLLYEVSVSPKPGLVDRFDSGAHADMDFFTYLDSSAALTEYFRIAYLEGAASSCLTPPELFPRLRRLGVQAEQQMYTATGGVNTHKGIIFTLGLFCGGLGWLFGRGESADEMGLLHLCSQIVTSEFERELKMLPRTSTTRIFHQRCRYHCPAGTAVLRPRFQSLCTLWGEETARIGSGSQRNLGCGTTRSWAGSTAEPAVCPRLGQPRGLRRPACRNIFFAFLFYEIRKTEG